MFEAQPISSNKYYITTEVMKIQAFKQPKVLSILKLAAHKF